MGDGGGELLYYVYTRLRDKEYFAWNAISTFPIELHRYIFSSWRAGGLGYPPGRKFRGKP